MKLPNRENALIERSKLCGYLLNPNHPQGRHKAAFFARLGYTIDRWELLEADLRQYHLDLDVYAEKASQYGAKYEIHGPITGPNGVSGDCVTVWIVETGSRIPRLVTAYPGENP